MIPAVVFQEGVDKTNFAFLGRASIILTCGGLAGRGSVFFIIFLFDLPPIAPTRRVKIKVSLIDNIITSSKQ